MLYITLDKNIQQAYVPRNGVTSQPVNLEAVSTSDRGIGAGFVIHEVQITGAFFLITLGLLEGLHEGEWEWTLTLDDGSAVTGLMQVVASQDDAVQYNKEIQYKAYGE